MRRLQIIVLLMASLLLALTACGKKTETPAPPSARMVKILKLEGSTGDGGRSYPGRLETVNQVELSFRVGGPLVELPIKEGDQVRKDQLLARIDPKDFQIQVDAARAKHREALANFDRTEDLFERNVVPVADLDAARSQRDMAKAALDDALANLSYTELKAPFSGSIGRRLVENFQDIRMKEPVLTLIDPDSLKVIIDVPEQLIARHNRDGKGRALARFEAAPNREFPLALREIATQADPRTQTYSISMVMAQPEGVNLLPGMTAQVTFFVNLGGEQGESDFSVPLSATFADENGNAQVWVVAEDMTVHARPVTLGDATGGDQTLILYGLHPGERIAVTGINQLREGMTVRELQQ